MKGATIICMTEFGKYGPILIILLYFCIQRWTRKKLEWILPPHFKYVAALPGEILMLNCTTIHIAGLRDTYIGAGGSNVFV